MDLHRYPLDWPWGQLMKFMETHNIFNQSQQFRVSWQEFEKVQATEVLKIFSHDILLGPEQH